MVDLWSPSEQHIWGALDEGCNSTCHSKAWGDLVEWKLKSFGASFLWVDAEAEAKYFTGLGSTTGALGRRKLPFCLSLDKGHDTFAGISESHEVDTARNPLLISLFAQSTLGLAKDMSRCACTVQGKTLELARCSDTGLLLLNLSQYAHRQHKLPLCIRETKLSPVDHPRAVVGAEPRRAMASEGTQAVSTSGGGGAADADAPDYDDPTDVVVEDEGFIDPVAEAADDDQAGVTVPDEVEPAEPTGPSTIHPEVSLSAMEAANRPDVVLTTNKVCWH